eukprot:350897-Chlamydomonas_euryale.AAC.2
MYVLSPVLLAAGDVPGHQDLHWTTWHCSLSQWHQGGRGNQQDSDAIARCLDVCKGPSAMSFPRFKL